MSLTLFMILMVICWSGYIPTKQEKLVEAWILLHSEELNSLWNLMKNGEDYFKIEPLK